MSDMMTPEEFLEHHGVKGMKWGVRKDRGHEGQKASNRKIKKADKKYDKAHKGTSGFIKVQNSIAAKVNSQLGELNSKPQYQGNLLDPNRSKDYANYLKDYEKVLDSAINSTMKDIGVNASGTKRLVVEREGSGAHSTWTARMEEIKHEDGLSDFPNYFLIKPKFQGSGKILSQEIKAVDEIPDEIKHYGVKGMKWGVRKSTIKTARKQVRSEKRSAKKDYKKGNISKEQRKTRVSDIRQSEKGHTARTLTRGEQVVSSIIFGPTIPVAVATHWVYSEANAASARNLGNRSNKEVSEENRAKRS